MKNNVTSIFSKKEKKLNSKIKEDLTSILKVLKLTKAALGFFKFYIPAANVLVVVTENIQLIEMKLKNEEIKEAKSKLEESDKDDS